ncbi:MAG: hypothetical protein M1825_000368 [Sarcosagium campestre]|nr:MAG: hypothetical protein M1825_000368 [Sarcosagium campestre]
MASKQITPEVTWAQRSSSSEPEKNYVFITIAAPDVSKDSLKVDLKPNSLTFSGYSDSKKINYHVELELYELIDPDQSKINNMSRDIEIVLRKKELKEEYWPRLLKDSKKVHFLKTDFNKWVDEDEQDGAPDETDNMNNFGGMPGGAGGMGGMGGMGGLGGEDGGFGGIDFSKLGAGAGGLGGLGGMPGLEGLGGAGAEGLGDEADEDDPDIPDLVGDSDEKPAAEETDTTEPAKPKIQEV